MWVWANPEENSSVLDTLLANGPMEEKDLSVALVNAAEAALTIMEQGVSDAANNYIGSHP